MSYIPKEGYKKVLVISAYTVICAAALYIALKFLLKPLSPFIIAWLIAMILRPSVNRISKRTGISKKVVFFFSILFIFVVISGIFIVLFGRLISEMKGLAEHLMSDAAKAVGDVFDYIEGLSEKLPLFAKTENSEAAEHLKQAIISMIESTLSKSSAKIPEAIMSFASTLPSRILFAVVLVLATFYMGNSVEKINSFIAGLIPESSRHYLFEAKKKFASTGIKYIKAYLFLLFVTFVQLLIGFLCLDIPYAFVLAAVIALIDILPVLGVGTVLVPWAIILFIQGNIYTGVGLLIIFAVIWVIRQITEPKIIGHTMGISPLATLIAIYLGYKLLGFWGIFILPLSVIFIKNLSDMGIFNKTKEKIEKT